MGHFQYRLTVATRGKGFYEITGGVEQWISTLGISTGLLTVFIQHTSASLLIQENADPDVVHDLEQFFRRIAPEDNRLYKHTVEGSDDMPAHIRAAITQTSIPIPIVSGRLGLGTWQGIYVVEHRSAPHRRTVVLHACGD